MPKKLKSFTRPLVEAPDIEAGYKRAPFKGYSTHLYSSRSEREKDYKSPITWDLLVRNPDIAEDQLLALDTAYTMLYNAELLDSPTQFAAMMICGMGTPVPLSDAAAICSCSREWLRRLEQQGRIQLLRSSVKKIYIRAEDLRKIMESRV